MYDISYIVVIIYFHNSSTLICRVTRKATCIDNKFADEMSEELRYGMHQVLTNAL